MMNNKSVESRILAYKDDKEYNRTPLMWAVRWKDVEAIRLILSQNSGVEAKAELNKEDSWGQTPLHLACSYKKPDTEIIKLLLDAGANPDAKNVEDETPLCKAVKTADINVVQLLLQYGASVKIGIDQEAIEIAESYGLIAIAELLKHAEVSN